MAFVFPATPAKDDTYDVYRWDSEKWTTLTTDPPAVDVTPVTLFTQAPPITGSDNNQYCNFRTICTTIVDMRDEFRVTFGCGTNLSITHAAAGEYAGDPGIPNCKAPLIVLKFADGTADGFLNKSTPQTSDWMPSGTLAGIPSGSKVMVSLQVGGPGQAGVPYIAGSTNSECYWQNDNTETIWDEQIVTGLGYNGIGASVYGVISIETRGAGGGGGPVDPPIPGGNTIPMTFNDPMFTSMTELTARVTLADDAVFTRKSIVERAGEPSITCGNNNTITLCRISSRECVRVGQVNVTFDKCYFDALGDAPAGDHADTVQHFVSATDGSRGTTVTWKNCHLVGHMVAATATYFSADDWGGTLVMENCIINSGPFGLKINAEPDFYFYVDFKDVYFIEPFATPGVPIQDNLYGNGAFVVLRWENVRFATIVGGVLVPGALSPAMVSTPLPTNLVMSSSAFDVWTAVGGTVTTNVSKDPVHWEMVADRFVETTANSAHNLTSNNISFTSGTTYTFSIYAKSDIAAAKFLQLALPTTAFGANAWGNFDTEAMTVQTKGSAATTSVRPPRSLTGWVRCIISAPCTATVSAAVAIHGITIGTATRAPAYVGVATNTRQLSDAQVETGAVDRPYVKTA